MTSQVLVRVRASVWHGHGLLNALQPGSANEESDSKSARAVVTVLEPGHNFKKIHLHESGQVPHAAAVTVTMTQPDGDSDYY